MYCKKKQIDDSTFDLVFNFEGTKYPSDVTPTILSAFAIYCGNFLKNKEHITPVKGNTVIHFSYSKDNELLGFSITVRSRPAISATMRGAILRMLDINDDVAVIGFNNSDLESVKRLAAELEEIISVPGFDATEI